MPEQQYITGNSDSSWRANLRIMSRTVNELFLLNDKQTDPALSRAILTVVALYIDSKSSDMGARVCCRDGVIGLVPSDNR